MYIKGIKFLEIKCALKTNCLRTLKSVWKKTMVQKNKTNKKEKLFLYLNQTNKLEVWYINNITSHSDKNCRIKNKRRKS